MSDKITITTPTGLQVTGTAEEVGNVLKALGLTKANYYHSETHGLVYIPTMDSRHIRNAMLKIYRTWVEKLSNHNGYDLLQALRNGCQDQTFTELLTEYVKRVNQGKA
jgi:hypothetical protein